MLISLKNKHTLQIDDFYFKCCIGKNGTSKKKIEGDLKTPVGTFYLEHLYYRKDRINKPETKLQCIPIQKYMGRYYLYINTALLARKKKAGPAGGGPIFQTIFTFSTILIPLFNNSYYNTLIH